MKKTWIVLGVILVLAGPLILISGTVYTLMLPSIYASAARISVSEDAPEIDPFAAKESYYSTYDPHFLRTQCEMIQSSPILYEVINRLNLRVEWGREGEKLQRDVALKILQSSVSVFQQRDTSLLYISVKRDNPMEAAKIANELAETYRDSRLDLANKKARATIDKLHEVLQEQKDRVDAAEKAVGKLRMEVDMPADGDRPSDMDNIRLQQLESDRLVAQQEMVEKEALLKIMADHLDGKDLIERASYISFDPMVMNTIRQIQDIEIQLVSLADDFGSNHPEVQRYRLQKKTLEKALEQRLVALKNGLETEYKVAKAKFENLNKILVELRPQVINSMGEKYRPFRNAQDNLESEKFIYEQLKAKLRQEMITLEVPRASVEIIDIAEPNNRPVSPNLFMNTMLSLGAGLVPFITGIVLIVAGTTRKRVML